MPNANMIDPFMRNGSSQTYRNKTTAARFDNVITINFADFQLKSRSKTRRTRKTKYRYYLVLLYYRSPVQFASKEDDDVEVEAMARGV